jgi:uncharacterized protein involved in exopolysaccharide biosynthesis
MTNPALILIKNLRRKSEKIIPSGKQVKSGPTMNIIAERRQDDTEVPLSEIFFFFWNNRLPLIATGAIGSFLAGLYLWQAPPVYEAKLQVEMAKTNIGTLPRAEYQKGAPIEDGPLLVERLRIPSTYTPVVTQSCQVQDETYPLEALSDKVKAKTMKSVNSVVEITVRGTDPTDAQSCAFAIFEMVRRQQNALLEPQTRAAQENIQALQARLKDIRDFLATMNKTEVQSAVYLSRRDEAMWLMEEIATLNRLLRQTTETRLVSPIYSTPNSISSGKLGGIIMGGIAGVLIGALLVFVRKQAVVWRNQTAS